MFRIFFYLLIVALCAGNLNAQEWAKSIGGTLSAYAQSVSVDTNGNFYIAGHYHGTMSLGNGVSLVAVGDNDGFVIKYNSLGECQWAKGLGASSGSTVVGSVLVDVSGNTYIIGMYDGVISLGNGVILASVGESYDGYVAKYNSLGECQWAQNLGCVSINEVLGLAVDSSDNLYVSGNYSDSISFGNGISLIKVEGFQNGFVAKYNSSGECQWAKSYGNNTYSYASCNGVSVDADGNLYVEGEYDDGIIFDEGVSITSIGGQDCFVAKFNSSGVCQWAKSQGSISTDRTNSMSVDSSGNVYVVGKFQDTMSLGDGISLTKQGGYLVKYNSSGVCQWANSLSDSIDSEYDFANSVSVDASGFVYVTGNFGVTMPLGNGISLKGKYNGYIAKYNSSGVCQWAKCLGGTKSSGGSSVVVDASGKAYIAGYYAGIMSLDNGLSLTANGDEYNAYVVRYEALYTNPPILITPALEAQNISINTPLTWNAVNNISSYRVQVSTTNDFSVPFVNEVVSATSKNLSNLLHNTRYYWRVQAISDTNTSDWSPTWNFVTIIPSDVAEAKSSDFSIAPQPVRNEAVVTYLNGKNTAISVELYDLKGTIVGTYNFTSLNEGTNKLRLDVSNLSNGIYNVIIKSGAEVHQAKMIKVD